MAKSLVGLDISATSVRAVEVADAASARPTVVRFAEQALADGAVSSGEVLEPNTVAGALKQLWSAGRFRSKDVVLGMGNQRVLSRDLTVPSAPIQQIRESLPFHVQDLLPVPVGDAILDFYPTREAMTESGPVVHGLLIAAVKDAVLANVRAVQLAGLNPVGVDLIPFALTRQLVTRAGVRGTVAVIEIGAETTSVVIATDGIPQFVRIIPTGGNDVTRALAGTLDISGEQAEAVKRHFGMAPTGRTEDDRRAISVTTQMVGELFASVRNTINYFVNTHTGQDVSELILAGGSSILPGLREAMADFVRLPVTFGDPFSTATFARSIDPTDVAAHGNSIAVAFGLASGSRAA